MAVVHFEEVDREEASFTDVEEYTRRFVAIVEPLGGHMAALRSHRPDLQRWQPHPENRQAVVQVFDPVQRDGTNIFDITVEYSTAISKPGDPLADPAEIEWETYDEIRQVHLDNEGRPLVNTAGSPIRDLTEPWSSWVINVRKKVGTVPRWILNYGNAVNSDSVRVDGVTFGPRELRLKRIHLGGYSEQDETRFRYLTMQLHHNPKTWDRFILNRGLYEVEEKRVGRRQTTGLGAFVKTLVPILNDDGHPITEPQFLDEDGRRPRVLDEFGAERLKWPLDPEDIIILRKKTAIQQPFRTLPLR